MITEFDYMQVNYWKLTDSALAYVTSCERQGGDLSPLLLLWVILLNSGKLSGPIASPNGIHFPLNYSNVKTATSFLHGGQCAPQISVWVIQLDTLETLGPVITTCNIDRAKLMLLLQWRLGMTRIT